MRPPECFWDERNRLSESKTRAITKKVKKLVSNSIRENVWISQNFKQLYLREYLTDSNKFWCFRKQKFCSTTNIDGPRASEHFHFSRFSSYCVGIKVPIFAKRLCISHRLHLLKIRVNLKLIRVNRAVRWEFIESWMLTSALAERLTRINF